MKKQTARGQSKSNATPTTHKALASLVGFVLRKIEKLALNADEFLTELQNRIRGQQPFTAVPFDKLNIIGGVKRGGEYVEVIAYTPSGELVYYKNGLVKPVSLPESVRKLHDIEVLWEAVGSEFDGADKDDAAYQRWLSDLEAALCGSVTADGKVPLLVKVHHASYGYFVAASVKHGVTVPAAVEGFIEHGDGLCNWVSSGYPIE